MNYLQLISSLLNGKSGRKLINRFTRKRSNNTWVWVSLLGVTLIGIMGGRNRQVRDQVQNGLQQAKNTFQEEKHRNPFDVNFRLATEIAKEIKPDFEGPTENK